MRADNSHHLAAAARRRRELTLAKAHQALRDLDASGAAITVAAIAAKAGVSRAWLYAETELRRQIDDNQQLRDQIPRLHGQLRTAKLTGPVPDTVHHTDAQLTISARSSGRG